MAKKSTKKVYGVKLRGFSECTVVTDGYVSAVDMAVAAVKAKYSPIIEEEDLEVVRISLVDDDPVL